jgi:hypothetical protein
MAKTRLPFCIVLALAAGSTAPAGAVVVLEAAPQAVAARDAAPEREPVVKHLDSGSMDMMGWAIGIAALSIAGIVLRRRTPSRVVAS